MHLLDKYCWMIGIELRIFKTEDEIEKLQLRF